MVWALVILLRSAPLIHGMSTDYFTSVRLIHSMDYFSTAPMIHCEHTAPEATFGVVTQFYGYFLQHGRA